LATTGSALKRGVSEPPLDFAITFSVPTQCRRCEYGLVCGTEIYVAILSKCVMSATVHLQSGVLPTLQSVARCGSFNMCSTMV